jgi:hypothetical protein
MEDKNCIVYSAVLVSLGTTSDNGSETVSAKIKLPIVNYQKVVVRSLTGDAYITDGSKHYGITNLTKSVIANGINPSGQLTTDIGAISNQKVLAGGLLSTHANYLGMELSTFDPANPPYIYFTSPKGSWPINPSAGSVSMQVTFSLVLELVK